jgi:hydrogenase maturation protease
VNQPPGDSGGPERVRAAPALHVLVVGLGASDRGDDAVGPAVVRSVAERVAAEAMGAQDGAWTGAWTSAWTGASTPAARRELRIQTVADPSRLIEEMAEAELVIVVDAVRSGAPPGTVIVVETGAGRPPLPARSGPTAAGTHGIGLADALELARALDRLPPRVVVVGVEAHGFDIGAPVSPGAHAGVPEAVRTVLDLLGRTVHEHRIDLRIPPAWLPHPTATWHPDRPDAAKRSERQTP